MSDRREIYTELVTADLSEIETGRLNHFLIEIASGTCNLMWLQEWHDWFHHFLGRLIQRSHEYWAGSYLMESLVTALMSLYPRGIMPEPYAGFRSDILRTLAVVSMDVHLWNEGEVRTNAMLWRFPNGNREQDCRDICGDFSCLMFFCIKYLSPDQIADWVSSVFRITCPHWRAQLMLWMIGSHGLLTGKIKNPEEFRSDKFDHLDPGWEWSHCLRGKYCEPDKNGYSEVDFIPIANLSAFNDAVRASVTQQLFFGWLDSFSRYQHLKDNLFELPERFADLYLPTSTTR